MRREFVRSRSFSARFALNRPVSAWALRLITAAVLLICIGFAARELVPVLHQLGGGFLAFNDFFAHWSAALFVRHADPAAIYDPAALHRFQLETEPALRQSFPFPYPPPYLFVVWPLGMLRFPAAQLAWDGVGLLLFVVAMAAPRWRAGAIGVAILAPTTAIALAYGQNGLIEGALLLAGLRLAGPNPALGGVLLGLATIKPALGLLVPVALLSARAWRAIAIASATALMMGLLAAWAFGPATWPAWLDYAAQHAAWLQGEVSDYRKPTVMATLSLLGASPAAAQAVQFGVAIIVAALVALCCRRGIGELEAACVLSGTFLALPFSFGYDLPAVTGAVLLGVQAHRGPWRPIEIGILSAGLLFPALTTATSRFFFVNPIALAALFGWFVWQCLRHPEPKPGMAQSST